MRLALITSAPLECNTSSNYIDYQKTFLCNCCAHMYHTTSLVFLAALLAAAAGDPHGASGGLITLDAGLHDLSSSVLKMTPSAADNAIPDAQ
jgi:hypothetical protein